MPPAIEAWSLNHWTDREVPVCPSLKSLFYRWGSWGLGNKKLVQSHTFSKTCLAETGSQPLSLMLKVKVTQSCPTLCNPMDCSWNFPGQNTGVCSLFLFQGIFPNPGLPHCRQTLYQLSHKQSQRTLEWVAYPFSRGSSWPRNRTRVFRITGRFFTNWAIREALIWSTCYDALIKASHLKTMGVSHRLSEKYSYVFKIGPEQHQKYFSRLMSLVFQKKIMTLSSFRF